MLTVSLLSETSQGPLPSPHCQVFGLLWLGEQGLHVLFLGPHYRFWTKKSPFCEQKELETVRIPGKCEKQG